MPRHAAVVGAVQAALRTAAGKHRWAPAHLVHAGEKRFGTIGKAHEIGDAARRTGVERAHPMRSAIARYDDAARRTVGKHVAENADDDRARIARVDRDARNVRGSVESEVRPGLPAVARMPHAIPRLDVVARIAL